MPANNIFIEYDDRIIARYKRTCVHAISGIRIHPTSNERVSFMLNSDWRDFDPATEKVKFNYSNDIIEIYSEQEDKVFRALNAYLFHNGFIAPYAGGRDVVSTTNSMSDEAISDLAGNQSIVEFSDKINALDSVVTLQRILDTVKSADRPYSFIRIIEKRLSELGK